MGLTSFHRVVVFAIGLSLAPLEAFAVVSVPSVNTTTPSAGIAEVALKNRVKTKARAKAKSKAKSNKRLQAKGKGKATRHKFRAKKRSGIAALLPTLRLRNLHKRMVAKKPVTQDELRQLSDAGDGLAAFWLARQMQQEAKSSDPDAIARYLVVAVKSGRPMAIRPLIGLLNSSPGALSSETLDGAEATMLAQAKKGSAMASDALRKFYARGAPFGAKPGEAMVLMQASAKQGNTAAAIEVAMTLLKQQPITPEDRATSLTFLKIAKTSKEPGQLAMAETLIRQLGAGEDSSAP